MDAHLVINRQITRYPLRAFFGLSFAFFWFLLLAAFSVIVLFRVRFDAVPKWVLALLTILGSWTPNLAAVITINFSGGREGLKRLMGMAIRFKIKGICYLAALIPILTILAAVLIYRSFESSEPRFLGLSTGFWLGQIMLNIFSGPTGEELGWRGFALPRLLQKYRPVKANLFLGTLWGIWHLPLWLISGYSGFQLLLYILTSGFGIISLTFLMTWIYVKSSFSLVPVAIIHFCFNFALNLTGRTGLGLAPITPLLAIAAGLNLIAVFILWSVWPLNKDIPEVDRISPQRFEEGL